MVFLTTHLFYRRSFSNAPQPHNMIYNRHTNVVWVHWTASVSKRQRYCTHPPEQWPTQVYLVRARSQIFSSPAHPEPLLGLVV